MKKRLLIQFLPLLCFSLLVSVIGCGGGGGSSTGTKTTGSTTSTTATTTTGSATTTGTTSSTAGSTSTTTGTTTSSTGSTGSTFAAAAAYQNTSHNYVLLFQSEFNNPVTLYTLTTGLISGVALSPDRSLIVTCENDGLWLYHTSGAVRRTQISTGFTQSNGISGPGVKWSPTGSLLMFRRDLGSLYTMKPDGTALNEVVSDCLDQDPSWSPDGTKICYVDSTSLVEMNADGSNYHQLYNYPSNQTIGGHCYGPDSKTVYFFTEQAPTGSATDTQSLLYKVQTGSAPTLLSSTTDAGELAISLDGSTLSYYSFGDNFIKPDGSGVEAAGAGGYQQSWMSTGALASSYSNSINIFLINPLAPKVTTKWLNNPADLLDGACWDAR